jgi:hypothetical protein
MKVTAARIALRRPMTEIHQGFDRQARVVRDAELGVDGLARHDVELVEPAVVEPAFDQVMGEPLPPAQLQAHAHVDEADRNGRGRQRQRQNGGDAEQDRMDVLLLQRVEEELVPGIDTERRDEAREDKGEDAGRQSPRVTPSGSGPEAARHTKERTTDVARSRLHAVRRA